MTQKEIWETPVLPEDTGEGIYEFEKGIYHSLLYYWDWQNNNEVIWVIGKKSYFSGEWNLYNYFDSYQKAKEYFEALNELDKNNPYLVRT